VVAVYRTFVDALVEKEGKQAAAQLSKDSLKLLEQLRDAALHQDEETVRKLPYGRRLTVLALRHVGKAEDLAKMDGAAVAVFCVKHKIVNHDWALVLLPGKVESKGDTATMAHAGSPGIVKMAGSVRHRFTKENGKWRIDLDPMLQLEGLMVENLLRQSPELKEVPAGVDVMPKLLDVAIFARLKAISGREATDDLWRPLIVK